jgi:hypothetical protein
LFVLLIISSKIPKHENYHYPDYKSQLTAIFVTFGKKFALS